MDKAAFRRRMSEGPLLLDGATGSNLMAAGMPRGVSTEKWVLEHPEVLQELQRGYLAAGSQVLYAPTFQAHRAALPGEDIHALNARLVAVTREVAGRDVLVGGDVSSTGKMAPLGSLSYEEALEIYSEQIGALKDAGVDLLVAETLLTVDEAAVILDAAAPFGLPVLCSLTIEADGSLLFGGNIFDACADLEAMGADAVGVNCSVGPDQLDSVIAAIVSRVSVPVIAKPNAGLPVLDDEGNAIYSMDAPAFAAHMRRIREAGASILGGCCGTTPEYIRALAETLREG